MPAQLSGTQRFPEGGDCCRRLSGEELNALFACRDYVDILFGGLVAPSPGRAVVRIAGNASSDAPIQGWEVDSIRTLRERIFELVRDVVWCNAIVIVAPHTHWAAAKPIIYSFDRHANRYLIGNLAIELSEFYLPVSFVFLDGIALPYEWCASNVGIALDEWRAALSIIRQAGPLVCANAWPLGLAIDFRFKGSLVDPPVATVETDIEHGLDAEQCSQIITYAAYSALGNEARIEQVAWVSHSDAALGLTGPATKTLDRLRRLVTSYPEKQSRQRVIEELEADLARGAGGLSSPE